ncbi:MAG: Stf0 family sulfotransferase [Acetobacteraceae bacterium]
MHDLVADEAASAGEMAATVPADRCYVVLFTPRSGSTWLTALLSATGRLGYPEEYLNPEFVTDVARALGTRDPARLIGLLQRRRKTPNGVFGIEVRAVDVALFGADTFFAGFAAGTLFYCLWRDNIVAQAVSLYRAVASGRFHSHEPQAAAPPYAADAIGHWLRHVAAIENDNLALLQEHDLAARFLRYEDIVRDRRITLALFAEPLHANLDAVDFASAAPGEPGRIGDEWNLAAETRFRAEQPALVAAIEAARAIRR